MLDNAPLRPFASGRELDLDWYLSAESPRPGAVTIRLEVPATRSRSGGTSAVTGPRSLACGVGIGSTGPRTLTACVVAEVASVVLTIGGRTERVELHADPVGRIDARVGVRLLPRECRIAEVAAFDAAGQLVARTVPEHLSGRSITPGLGRASRRDVWALVMSWVTWWRGR